MERSEKAMSCVIELMLQKPRSTQFLSGVIAGVGVQREASSSSTKSKLVRLGVCTGVSIIDDESQLELSDENEEPIDELEEKEDAEEWVFDPNRMF